MIIPGQIRGAGRAPSAAGPPPIFTPRPPVSGLPALQPAPQPRQGV